MALGVGVSVPNAANAAALVFDDTSPNETITIFAGQFEGGFSVNGVQIAPPGPASAVSGTVTLPEVGPVTFSGSWIDLGQSGAGSRTIYLVEQNTPNLISDTLQFQWSTDGEFGTISGVFSSDVNDNLGTLPAGVDPGDVFPEIAGEPAIFSLPFLGGEIHSADAPEPGTLALLGLGLAGLGFGRRRNEAQA